MHMKIKLLMVLICGLSIAGCATDLNHKANREVSVVSGSLPRGCQFRGNVSVTYKDVNGGPDSAIHNDQINDLKGQAGRLGANLLLITGKRSHYYHEYFTGTAKMNTELEAQMLTGRAYLCPRKRF